MATRRPPNRQSAANAQFSLGLVAFGRGDHRAAVEWLEQSLATMTALNDTASTAMVALYLGLAELQCGEPTSAQSTLVKSLRLMAADRDDHGIAQVLEGLASLAAAVGDAHRALRLFAAAAEIRARLGLPLPTDGTSAGSMQHWPKRGQRSATR